MMQRPVQYFSDEYLEQSSRCSSEEIAQFLEDMRLLTEVVKKPDKSKLISLKISENLLSAFRTKCSLEGKRYQTKIKDLMAGYLLR